MAWQRAFADMKVIAIMIVRNEEAYLSRCLAYLKSQGLRAAVIDNGSTDSTPSILASHQPDTVVHVEHVPFNGMFEWEALLKHAHAMQAKVDADWVHLNSADEMCSGTRPGERLLDAIKRVDAEGYDAINYEEFVFPPTSWWRHCEGREFDRIMKQYYFYAPSPVRQIRTWKNRPGLSNVSSGGHLLTGRELNLHPENFILRHYIALSRRHFLEKYATRVFPPEELARGWHGNRVGIGTRKVRFPHRRELKVLAAGAPWAMDRSDPWVRHFWE